jgi:hypothetical protein
MSLCYSQVNDQALYTVYKEAARKRRLNPTHISRIVCDLTDSTATAGIKPSSLIDETARAAHVGLWQTLVCTRMC